MATGFNILCYVISAYAGIQDLDSQSSRRFAAGVLKVASGLAVDLSIRLGGLPDASCSPSSPGLRGNAVPEHSASLGIDTERWNEVYAERWSDVNIVIILRMSKSTRTRLFPS